MTREEASFILANIDRRVCDDELNEALDMAIKALEQQSCGDAISRQAVLNAMYELCDTGETLNENPWRDNPHIDAITDAINNLPLVTSQPKTGHWEKTTDKYCYYYKCSCCGTKTPKNEWGSDYFSPYCPNCGARMVELQERSERICLKQQNHYGEMTLQKNKYKKPRRNYKSG